MLVARFLTTLVLCIVKVAADVTNERIFTVAIGYLVGTTSYINDEGYHTGFFRDLIDEVCREATIQCRTVLVPWEECWDSKTGAHQRGGNGLLDGWFDACIGAHVTVNRLQVFTFTMDAMYEAHGGYFFIKPNSTFQRDQYFRKRIGFYDGWYTDEKCLAREMGTSVPDEKVFHFANIDFLMDALRKNKIDVIFVLEIAFGDLLSQVQQIGPPIACAVKGAALMSRKDSDFPAIWDEGFSKLQSNGRYKRLCEESNARHETDERQAIKCPP